MSTYVPAAQHGALPNLKIVTPIQNAPHHMVLLVFELAIGVTFVDSQFVIPLGMLHDKYTAVLDCNHIRATT